MRKKILLIAIPVVFLLVLSAQITQKQADTIIMERMSEKTQPYTIFSKNGVQEKTTITFADGEIFDLEYPCFVYYIRYEEKTNDKFLIVNENNGNLLEIRTQANAEPCNLAEWRIVEEERQHSIMDILRGEWRWFKTALGGYVGGVADNEFESIIKILSQNEDASINYEVFVADTLFYRGSFQLKEVQWNGQRIDIKLPHGFIRWNGKYIHWNHWAFSFRDVMGRLCKDTLAFSPGSLGTYFFYQRIRREE